MCKIESGAVGELTTLDMPYRITHVKACQGHHPSLIEKVGTSPLAKQVVSLDYDFSVDDLARGLYPKVPIYPHLHVVELSSGHYLHRDFPWCIVVQRPRVYDTTCPLGN